MTHLIEAVGLSKSIGSKVILNNVSLEVRQGTLFALLGPNGAGKTTFIKLLLNLSKMQKGSLTINGIPVQQESSRQNLSFLPEKFSFFPYYTVKATLLFFGQMSAQNQRDEEELNGRLQRALEKLNIKNLENQRIKTLSKGQLQRVGLAKMYMGDPQIIILDEPFSGLDPIGIKDLKNLLLELKAQGKTIFINSHILSEVEQICDDLAILREGEIVAKGQLRELIKNSRLEDYFYEKVQGHSPA